MAEAIKLADRLYHNSSCKAHRRFDSGFVRYYEDRQKAELWLFNHFKELGGLLKLKNPLYFALQVSEEVSELSNNFGDFKEVKLNLNEIAEDDISFTLGDSMALYYEGVLTQVLTKNELLLQLALYNNDVKEFLSSLGSERIFIEAQLWGGNG